MADKSGHPPKKCQWGRFQPATFRLSTQSIGRWEPCLYPHLSTDSVGFFGNSYSYSSSAGGGTRTRRVPVRFKKEYEYRFTEYKYEAREYLWVKTRWEAALRSPLAGGNRPCAVHWPVGTGPAQSIGRWEPALRSPLAGGNRPCAVHWPVGTGLSQSIGRWEPALLRLTHQDLAILSAEVCLLR